ncbi:hypothetical protein HJD18_13600 [Thermoleophilia bacterium SCSIO 60948]|nr:hypothetical protein HJD18_13600 [Thermoleophilia bacterium SCSIO 60948]
MSEVPTISFTGLVVPAFDEPLIELQTLDGRRFDLYNWGWLQPVTFGRGALTFTFQITEYWEPDGAPAKVPCEFLLKFAAVRNLKVCQPSDWDAREAGQIDHLHIRPEGQSPRIRFLAGGLTYEFDAGRVEGAARA